MPKDKDRTLNPAQAQRKLDKQKALKKGKADAAARRNEKLARRNPERIQRQINDLKGIEESGQPLRPREKQILEELERDLRAVHKAREALGEKAPQFNQRFEGRQQGQYRERERGQGRGDGKVLGKRRRGDGRQQWREESDGSETDEDVRNIPMPRDTPPPIPHQYRRRREAEGEEGPRQPHALPAKPEVAAPARTTYESAPVIRDLRQEAISKFVPAAVRKQQDAIRGQGRLVEPEEMDKLEQAGYLPTGKQQQQQPGEEEEDPEDILRRIEEETRARPQHNVDIEEVTDEEL
jgi:WW domain binding protein 11